MTAEPEFALNHMCAPKLGIPAFFALAKDLGISAVEIRNDLEGQAILDGTAPETIRNEASSHGMHIISINALQRFNEWNSDREREALELVDFASRCGAEALVLVPTNDGTGRANGERQANLRIALKQLAPILNDAGVRGLVEPLGFEACSLRLKSEAADAINAIDASGTFAIVHDTFHHHLAGEDNFFPELTGLVHISGVTEGSLAISDMRDGHRVLVDAHDRLGNIEQITELRRLGYRGRFSFEPFSDSVHKLENLEAALDCSLRFMISELEREAV